MQSTSVTVPVESLQCCLGQKNMIHDDEGGPEWPEEEVRLDKWRSERGQKVI